MKGEQVMDMFQQVVKRSNWEEWLQQNKDRIESFGKEIANSRQTCKDRVVVVLPEDDPIGSEIIDLLMLNWYWSHCSYKREGRSFSMGLASRSFIEGSLELLDPEKLHKLKKIEEGVLVIVIDSGIAEIFQF